MAPKPRFPFCGLRTRGEEPRSEVSWNSNPWISRWKESSIALPLPYLGLWTKDTHGVSAQQPQPAESDPGPHQGTMDMSPWPEQWHSFHRVLSELLTSQSPPPRVSMFRDSSALSLWGVVTWAKPFTEPTSLGLILSLRASLVPAKNTEFCF